MKTSSWNLEDLHGDQSENKEATGRYVQAAATMKILQRYVFTKGYLKMVTY